MFDSIWPIALVVLSNTFYQICAKEVPEKMDPFASLTVTYLVGAAVSFALFGLLYKEVVTPTKVAGILICLVGLYFINK